MFLNEFKNSTTLVSHLQKIGTTNDTFFTSTPIYNDDSIVVNKPNSFITYAPWGIHSGQYSPQSLSSSSTSPKSLSGTFNSGNGSYTSTNTSRSSNDSMNSIPQKKFKKVLPIRSAAIDMSNIIQNSRKCQNKNQYCSFCKSNGESEEVYGSHLLKDPLGKVLCPILRLCVCPICGEHGDNAHTITYCKQSIKAKRFQMLQNALSSICNE